MSAERRTQGVPRMPAELVAGACARHPQPAWWHSSSSAEVEAAKLVCTTRCPVQQICLSWALSLRTSDDLLGTLGGLSASERTDIRRSRRRAVA